MICPQALLCSGCSRWGVPYEQQLRDKIAPTLLLLRQQGLQEPRQVEVMPLADRGLRDRLDFQIRGEARGLWDKGRKKILDLPECLQLSPELQNFLNDFRQIPLSMIQKGSFRLRVSPTSERGLWLDLSNEDVKNLFDERETLQALNEMAHVEIGQRRKTLHFVEGKPKLAKDPQLRAWTRTWIESQPFPLYSRIADFSQVGDKANHAIVEALHRLLPQGREILEFGSGNGNLSFPALGRFERLRAYEFDVAAAEGLKQSFRDFVALFPQKTDRLVLHTGDFRQRPVEYGSADAVLVNPARSGSGEFLSGLAASEAQSLIYMSCYPQSMATDLARFARDWTCERMIFVDPFPQSDHIEVLSLWGR